MLINDRTSRVIKMFCSVHNERFELLEPYVANGYIYATDTFSVIRVPTSLEEDENTLRLPPSETYSAGKKFPLQVIESVYEKPVVVYDYVIRVSQLDTLFESFKKVPVLDYSYQIKCPKCH